MHKTEKQLSVRVDASMYEAVLRFQKHKSIQIGENVSLALALRIALREGLRPYLQSINRPKRSETAQPKRIGP